MSLEQSLFVRAEIALCFCFLLWEGILDYKTKTVLLPPAGGFFLIGLAVNICMGRESLIRALSGAAIGAGVLILAYLTKNKIGYGDGFVLVATGALLGFRLNLAMFLFGLFLASLKGIWLIITGKADRKTKMAFVPFLIPGLTLSLSLVYGGFS